MYTKFFILTLNINAIVVFASSEFATTMLAITSSENDAIYQEIEKAESDYYYNEDYNKAKFENISLIDEFSSDNFHELKTTALSNQTNNVEEITQILKLNFPVNQDNSAFTCPQFMTDLYQAISDENTGFLINNLHKSSIVMSIPEIEPLIPGFFKFNLSKISLNDIQDVELHIYRIGQQISTPVYHAPYYLLRLYQVLNISSPLSLNPDENQLLTVHYVSSVTTGWQIFKIQRAIEHFKNDTSTLNLMVTASTVLNQPVEINFARNNLYGSKYQPSLIIFKNDNNIPTETLHMSKRSLESRSDLCTKHNLYIDFANLGLKNIILAPEGYDANQCIGKCSLQNKIATNHASFVSLLNKEGYNAGQPCCVAEEMKHLPLLYIDGNVVVFKRVKNMIVLSCGCR